MLGNKKYPVLFATNLNGKMKLTARFLAMLFFGSLLYTTCTDPTTLGADLFEEDLANIDFTDTLSLSVSSELGDSVLTYNASSFFQLNSYLFGDLVDPIFGKSSASIYLQPLLDAIEPDFTEAVVDSFVLVIPYDTSRFYGNTDQEFEMEVYQLDESFVDDANYYSSQDLLTKMTAFGSGTFRPGLDSLEVFDYDSDGSVDTLITPPQLRLQLPLSFAQELLDQPATTYASDTAFLGYFNGVYLKPSLETDGLISFDFRSGNAGMYLYYKDAEGKQQQFIFEVSSGSIYYGRFEHDYTGSVVEPFLNDVADTEEVGFIQGMAGLITKVEIPYIENVKGFAVNKAELELTVKTLDDDIPAVFDPLDDLILVYKDDNGFLFVRDLSISEDPVSPLTKETGFGGVLLPQDNGQPSVYRMNISTHLQDILDGSVPNVFYILAHQRSLNGGRVAIYGPNDPAYGPKINVAFTQL